jgi:hypothetical protein
MDYTQDTLYCEIEAYLQHINFALNCYEAYNALYNIGEIDCDFLNISPGFFTVTRYALSKCLLIETAKLFCGSGDERTLQKLIKVVKSNNSIFINNRAKQLCEDANNAITNYFLNTISKIKARRDKDLSHNDPLFFHGNINPAEVNYISPDEIQEILSYSFNFCVELLECLPCNEKVILTHGADDLKNLVNHTDYI